MGTSFALLTQKMKSLKENETLKNKMIFSICK